MDSVSARKGAHVTDHDDRSEELEFVGPDNAGWYRTAIPDWIMLHPEIGHTSYRLFCIIRSLMLEKRAKVRLLSHEQLAFLLPGPNGKPSGVRTIKDALAVLERLELVTNPDRRRLVTSTGKGGIHTRRRYQINDWPTQDYDGWRNTFDKLDAFTQDWRQTRSDQSGVSAGQNVGQNSAQRSDQDEPGATPTPEPTDTPPASPAQTDVPPGEYVGQNSADSRRNFASSGRNSARHADATSDDTDPLNASPEASSSSQSEADSKQEQEEEGSLAREDEDDAAAAVEVLDRALAAWPGGHRRPVAAERARLVERVTAELSSGAEEEDVVYHLSRDLEPSRVSTTAVQVIMGRTKAPGWGLDPRPASQAPHSATESPRVECGLHAYATVPCGQCRADFRVGDVQALRVELERLGAQERPDLAALLGVATAAV